MSRKVAISWNQISREAWDGAHAEAGASYQQDWAYGAVLTAASPGAQVLRASVARGDGSLMALAQVTARPIAMMGRFALCTHGPVWIGDVLPEDKAAAYRVLRKSAPLSWPRLLAFSPDESRGPEAGLKGMSRVMTGDATVLIDLTQEEATLRASFASAWRNRLSKSEKSELIVHKGGVKPAHYRWLLDAEAKQRASRGYRAMPLSMTEAWQAAKADAAGGDRSLALAVFRADLGRVAAAGMLFLIHGSRATYHVGWTSEEGRTHAAHNLILWAAMKDLKARGIAVLDLGGVNTQSGAGIARFKIETGGRVLQRAGVFV